LKAVKSLMLHCNIRLINIVDIDAGYVILNDCLKYFVCLSLKLQIIARTARIVLSLKTLHLMKLYRYNVSHRLTYTILYSFFDNKLFKSRTLYSETIALRLSLLDYYFQTVALRLSLLCHRFQTVALRLCFQTAVSRLLH
jgi:hypothetical protein